MVEAVTKQITARPVGPTHARHSTVDPTWVRRAFILVTLLFLGLFLALPLAVVFTEAFRKGLAVYWESVSNREARSAIYLTLLTAGISVPLNVVFGLAASWAIAKFNFAGKSFLLTLIDLPFAISPVISGLIFVLIFGLQGWFGGWLAARHVEVMFAAPGLVLATIFVTFPFVARELIPLMQEQGTQEEQAALVLGASGWQTFWRITVPNVKWALLYGVILCNARAMGEFGAVAVVSGHVQGKTNTMPLHIEVLYSGGPRTFAAAFAVASLLALLALLTLVVKSLLEWKVRQDYLAAADAAMIKEEAK